MSHSVKIFTLAFLAHELHARYEGDADALIRGIAPLDQADSTQVSFIVSAKYKASLLACDAGAVIMREEMSDFFAGNKLIVDDPYLSYSKLTALFVYKATRQVGIHPSAVVASSAKVAPSASIGPYVVIGDNVTIGADTDIAAGCSIGDNTVIGDNCKLYPNVCIYHGVSLGRHVIIHSSTVIGSDGFGYAPTEQSWSKIHQLGSVVVGNHVEIGASCAIDRGALDDTIIEDDVIIDNQVHIAHNVHIGKGAALAGCVGVAGSTHIGAGSTFGGQVGVAGHLNIHPGSHFNGGASVVRDTDKPGLYASAIPAIDVKSWRRNVIHFGQLDNVVKRIKRLEKIVDNGEKE